MSGPIFITGTDTGVGKTVASLLLIQALQQKGHAPFYWKPLQTGCLTPDDAESDARFIYEHCAPFTGRSPAESIGFFFAAPKAPLYAARDEAGDIPVEILLRKLAILREEHAPLVVEGAGGLMVPITSNYTMIDFIRDAGAQILLVARAGLGTINHTLLSIEALQHRGMEPAGIVFLQTKEHITPDAMVEENMETISMFSQNFVSGVVPPLRDFQAPPKDTIDLFVSITTQLGY